MIPISFFDCQHMKDHYAKIIREQLPAAVSGILIALAFPKPDLFGLAWIGFVPLLLSLWGKDRRQAFVSGYVFGLFYFFGTLYWIYHSINHFGGVSLVPSVCIVFLLCLYLGLYPAIFAFIYTSMIGRTRLPALLISPVAWVTLELLRSYAFTGFPWSSIGYSQYKFLHMIQIADITGIYGISFLVLAVNGAVVDLMLLRKRTKKMPLFPTSYTLIGMALLAALLVSVFGYGVWRLGQDREGETFRASVIQGNIEQDKKWDPAFQKEVLDAYFGLSQKAAESMPGLIVWPETAVPFLYGYDSKHTEELVEFQKKLGANLLLGGVMVNEAGTKPSLLSNSAVLLDRGGKAIYKYDKMHLVPFGEYVPLRKVLFFIDKIVEGIGDYVPGRSYIRAGTEFGSFATLICYEIIFPGMVRKFYTKGGDFIVTITNDAWFGKTAGPYQHFSMAVFRAIENRKPVIRSANTGISGFIDASGRIISKTALFTRETSTAEIKTDRTLTFYTKYGDLFSFLCVVLFIVISINIKIWR